MYRFLSEIMTFRMLRDPCFIGLYAPTYRYPYYTNIM